MQLPESQKMSRTLSNSNSPSQDIFFEEKTYTASSTVSELLEDPMFSRLRQELSSSIIQLKTLDLALNSFMKLQKATKTEKEDETADLFKEIAISEKSTTQLGHSLHKLEDTFQDIEISLKS